MSCRPQPQYCKGVGFSSSLSYLPWCAQHGWKTMSLVCLNDKTKQNNDWCANNDFNMRCLCTCILFACFSIKVCGQNLWNMWMKCMGIYKQTELFKANILKNKQANKQTKTWCMLNEQGDSIDENCKNLTHIQNFRLDLNISLKAFFFSQFTRVNHRQLLS